MQGGGDAVLTGDSRSIATLGRLPASLLVLFCALLFRLAPPPPAQGPAAAGGGEAELAG